MNITLFLVKSQGNSDKLPVREARMARRTGTPMFITLLLSGGQAGAEDEVSAGKE